MNVTLPYNTNFEYIEGCTHLHLHTDDWTGVAYEGAELLEAQNQVQFMPTRQPIANHKFLLQEPESHLCVRAHPLQRVRFPFLLY